MRYPNNMPHNPLRYWILCATKRLHNSTPNAGIRKEMEKCAVAIRMCQMRTGDEIYVEEFKTLWICLRSPPILFVVNVSRKGK